MPPRTRPAPLRRIRTPGFLAAAAPVLLAGSLQLPADTNGRWGWSGSWVHPVGDPYVTPGPVADRAGDFRVTRGVRAAGGRARDHDGVDLANGRGGDIVRAAGNGLVVQVSGSGWNHGYGRHVVLAHRLAEGTLAYSVYAHLDGGSVLVRRGEFLQAGRPIGRVGRSGRASAPHLHFEVRTASDPSERWQRAPVVDPLAFVAARLPTSPADTCWWQPYLAWAECAGLVDRGRECGRRPARSEWWQALLRATRNDLDPIPVSEEGLRAAVVELGLLPEGSRAEAGAPLEWDDLALDVRGARRLGARLPTGPVPGEQRALDGRRVFGNAAHAGDPEALAWGRDGGPGLAEMCLVLSELAGDPPPSGPPTRRRFPAAGR